MAANTDPMSDYGDTLKMAAFPSGGVTPTTFTAFDGLAGAAEIAKCRAIDPPEPTAGDVNVSHLKTKVHEYIPGRAEPGTLSFDVLYDEAAFATLYAATPDVSDATAGRGRRTFASVWPDGSGQIFIGYIKSIKRSGTGTNDDPLLINVTIKVSGPVNFVSVTT